MNSIDRARSDAILLISARLFCRGEAAGGKASAAVFSFFRLLCLVGLLCAGLSLPLAAKGRRAALGLDGNYTSALAAADRFLQAWQAQNQEDGLVLLSDAAKQHASEERIERFFEHGEAAAYEIDRGKMLKGGRYDFPVTLFGVEASEGKRMHPRSAHIVVGRTSKDEWAVDRLP
jgi:hypothetical protein